MQTLPTLSIKCDRCGAPKEFRRLETGMYPGVVLCCPGCEGRTRLTSVEEALLSLIADQAKQELPTAAEPTTPNTRLADMLLYLTRVDRDSQRWWSNLPGRYQKKLIDCGYLHHLNIADPEGHPAVETTPHFWCRPQPIGKPNNDTVAALAADIAGYFASVMEEQWDELGCERIADISLDIVDILKRRL